MRDADIDLFFPTIAEREVQYNARESVADFDACVRRYAESAAAVKSRRPGLLNLRYGMGQDERLDLFLPAANRGPAPLFVFIHGGYWRAQRKEDAPVMAEAFNAAGAAVAVPEYTLAPEATLPEIVREMRSALAWLYHNAATYGVDPERIYVGGSSAGGHLAAMLAAPAWPARYGVPDDVIKGTLALSGLFDLRPLCDVLPNTWLQLTPEQAARHSRSSTCPSAPAPCCWPSAAWRRRVSEPDRSLRARLDRRRPAGHAHPDAALQPLRPGERAGRPGQRADPRHPGDDGPGASLSGLTETGARWPT